MSQRRAALLVVSNLLLVFSILLFALGFFPYKPFLPGTAKYESNEDVPITPFNKVIFMVVDALRRFGTNTLDEQLIRDGDAIPFTAHAASPTITMPKVKAMTTGSVPSFLDVILNFAESDTTSTLETQDTWLAQLKNKPGGKQLVMYGDDTWLKLFPNTFGRSDGTSSFFVSDFTEVDYNVTRHIPRELENNDWSGMILHFLGIDHIGHKSGPRSLNMGPKQKEMDSVIKTIYEAMKSKPHLESTLLILCGDHGMNDAGNHGGSAPGETSPALTFISSKFRNISTGFSSPGEDLNGDFTFYEVVEQSDIAPTLAGLLGFPVPLNNLGVFIPSFLHLWLEGEDQLKLLYRNALQMMQVVSATYEDVYFSETSPPRECAYPRHDGTGLYCLWANSRNLYLDSNAEFTQRKDALLKFLKAAQQALSSTASNYDISKLKYGILGAMISAILAVFASYLNPCTDPRIALWGVVLILGYGIMMFASSFVEEEHQFWYWVGSVWFIWLSRQSFIRKLRARTTSFFANLLLLASLRLLRRWNQTGQKLTGEPDIARVFLPQHTRILWILVTATFLSTWCRLYVFRLPFLYHNISSIIGLCICVAGLGFKLAFTKADAPELLRSLHHGIVNQLDTSSLLHQARAAFAGLALAFIFIILQTTRTVNWHPFTSVSESIQNILTLFLVIQTRASNIPVFLIFHLQHLLISGMNLQPDEISMTAIILQSLSFFALGGSNAISSVDLSNAYNGISDYNVVAVGILTFLGNWAGPVWWATEAIVLLLKLSKGRDSVLLNHFNLLTVWTSASAIFVMSACTALRTHLFIWTVFSPKYLYLVAWSVVHHILINLGLSCLIWVIC